MFSELAFAVKGALRRRVPMEPAVSARASRLPGRELRVGDRVGEVGRRGLVDEADHGAVDVDSRGAVGGTAGAGDQVGPGGREVEDLHLVDLALVEPFLDRLLRPLAELGIPERAVRL